MSKVNVTVSEYIGDYSKDVYIEGETLDVIEVMRFREDLSTNDNEIVIDEEELIRFIKKDTKNLKLNKHVIRAVINSYDKYLDSKGLLE